MKHRAELVVAGIAALVALSIAASGVAGAARQGQASAIKPPRVPDAAAIKAKYGGQTVTWAGDNAVGSSHKRDLLLAARFQKDTGIKIKLVPHPAASDAAYSQLARNFSSKSASLDVVMIDVVWPGAFAPYLVDLKPKLGAQAKLHTTEIVANNTVDGKLVAMPWFGDFGILYYRTDLLKKYGYSAPPKTWKQLGTMAKKIQAGERGSNPDFYGLVYQGKAYEGLTCDSLEWLASSGGGHFIDNGKASNNNPKAVATLNMFRGWVGNISPRSVTSYGEEEARNAFASGNAAFMRNWLYAYAANQTTPVEGKFDVTVLPHGAGPSVGTVGGWQLAVSKYSKRIDASIELVRYLTSPAVERFDAIYNTNVPTILSVATDPDVVKVNPYLKPEITNVARVTRPASSLGVKYNQGSQIIYRGINQILNGQDAKNVLPGIQQGLDLLLR